MIAPDPLAELREQIRSATDAAERLVRHTRAVRAPPPPPRPAAAAARPKTVASPPTPRAGWQQTERDGGPELVALVRLLAVLRELLPAELQQQVTDLIRQMLVLLRALIDWAVTRLDQDARGREVEVEVEDIPIA